MPYKPRTKPPELITLELLNCRMNFTSQEKRHYLSLKKGYEGEKQFDTLTEKLQCDCLILDDLLLEVNNTTFQIDSLIITHGNASFYEVKNYTGDYYYESDKLFKKPNLQVVNPLHQLSRSETLLRQLLLSSGFNLSIDSSVIFINPEFTLYQAPLDKPIIFPNQLNRYMNELNALPAKLTKNDVKLAEQLVSLNMSDSPFEQLPSYDYDQLRKGIICPNCRSFSINVVRRKCICQDCGYSELASNAILRSTKEFKILFPNEKITTNIIHNWCQVVPSKQRIRNVLLNNFTRSGAHRWSYFE
ncbi:nuclease-related domain-containing protein [Lentibacillus sp. CBA3610]|uniref:nuclease-related domain-containing protein n=1 Tax=Lentibacillus sp. CBA3610 TaxID=2518176 RepID=UPI00159631BB|nr:nuclease-related domain-containing protein [Lentibacillus sp. CBA3610]